jgi:hypothetical protein
MSPAAATAARRDIGPATDNDVFLARHESELIAFAASHEVTGVIPAVPEAISSCRRVVPVTDENILSPDQKFADLSYAQHQSHSHPQAEFGCPR